MASETAKIMRERRRVLSASFSPTVVNYLLYDNTLTQQEKQEVMKIAKQIALQNGHIRVYWEDFQIALRKFFEARSQKNL
ncbi:MAG: hypothetical protein QW734_06500 [Candidatus Bathyarchaeia archaeon]